MRIDLGTEVSSDAVYGGRGVEKDLKEAEYLFRKAAEQGVEQAKAALERIGSE